MRPEAFTRGAIAILAIAMLVGACGSGPAGNSTVFRSKIYGYSLELADGWSTVQARRELHAGELPLTSSGATDVIGVDADIVVRRMELPALIVAAQEVPPSMTLDRWTREVEDVVLRQKGCDDPTSDHREVGGEPAVILRYPNCPEGLGLYHLWTAVVHEGRGYHLVFFGERGHEHADRKTLDELLETVRLH